MALFYIADLHLSLNDESKSMSVFGGRWKDYEQKIEREWRAAVKNEDTVILGGDLSWAMTLPAALPDFAFIDSLPGRKIVLEGNHDFYWNSLKKMKQFCADNGFSFEFLRNNAFSVEGISVCGSRGWYTDDKVIPETNADSRKIIAREAGRLRASLNAGKELGEPVVFMHFPPVFGKYKCEEFIDIMLQYGVKDCYFGHIHGKYDVPPVEDYRGIAFHFAAADFLFFKPLKVN